MQLDNVLFVGAHADDIELFAGATLSRLCKTGCAVNCMTFSSHKGISDHRAARAEHCTNMRALGLHDNRFDIFDLGACDGSFQTHRDMIYQQIRKVVVDRGIKTIITHPDDTNQDHQQVRAEVIRAAKGMCSILGGEFPFNQVSGRVPDCLVPVRDRDVENKVEMISKYASQKLPGREYFRPEVWYGLASVRGATIGKGYAEGFFVERIVYD